MAPGADRAALTGSGAGRHVAGWVRPGDGCSCGARGWSSSQRRAVSSRAREDGSDSRDMRPDGLRRRANEQQLTTLTADVQRLKLLADSSGYNRDCPVSYGMQEVWVRIP